MMKKLICIICTMFVLCGQVNAKSSYIPDDVINTEYENVYEILSGLSIVDRNDDGSFRPLTSITRGDYAVALSNIMNVFAQNDTVYFKDVPKEHKAFEAVAKLTANGIIDGFGDGVFRPDDTIKVAEAVKMLTTAMGYFDIAEKQGGYPDGYMQTAQKIGLFKGVKYESNDEILRGEAAQMLLNSLELPVIVKENLHRLDKTEFKIDEDTDFLYAAMGIKKIKGIVNANDRYSIDGKAVASKDSLRIGDTTYYCPEWEWNDFVGYNVICYYYEDDDYYENKIIYLQKNASLTNEMTVAARNAEQFSFPNFYYESDKKGKLEKITVSDELTVIYNGLPKATIEETDFFPVNGVLNFIDNNNDSKYDIVHIKSYTNALVSEISEEAIYISEPNNSKIKIDDYEKVMIFNQQGDEVLLSELKENDVISLYETLDKSLLTVVFSRDRITGAVTKKTENDGDIEIVINDIKYYVAVDYDNSFPSLVSIGMEGTFCLDANGDIYTMIGEKITTNRYGYLIRAWEHDDKESHSIRLLEETGKLVDRTFASKVKVDGQSAVSSLGAYNAARNAILNPVVFRINKTGEITMLDTISSVTNNEDDRLSPAATGISGMYRTRTMCFDAQLAIDENTKIFVIPEDPTDADENEFGFADYKILDNEVRYSNINSYSISDSLTADIVVMNDNSSQHSLIGIVTKTGMQVNSDDEVVTYYTLQTGDGEQSYPVSEERVSNEIHRVSGADSSALIEAEKQLTIEKGDLVKIYTNSAGEIEKICIIYDFNTATAYSTMNTGDVNVTSYERFVVADISEIDGGIVKLKRTDGAYEYHNLKGKTIFIYDDLNRSTNCITKGNMGDLVQGNRISVITKGGIPQYVFAY